jgi:primosomal protein N' (replication factor Y)
VKQQHLFEAEPTPWELADQQDLLCAQVVVNRPLDLVFDYLVPDPLRPLLRPGQRVKVPFGRGDRLLHGMCVGTKIVGSAKGLKYLAGLVDDAPIVSTGMLDLTKWISERYLCPWGQVLEGAVPAAVKAHAGTRRVVLLALADHADIAAANMKLSARQQAVLKVLREAGAALASNQVAERAGCGPGPINALRKKRLIVASVARLAPEPVAPPESPAATDLVLNADQRRALEVLLAALRANEHHTYLLHGVTGSGKTEVYLQAIREVVGYGRQAIVLVPEISLTPQTIRRFRQRFSRVAVLHSHLADRERNISWRQIAAGEVDVVVGARSAIFAPTKRLGLIVIDEEHETSFKQDTAPRYHAREVARKRAELEGVPLVLGSATPTLESWHRAQTGLDRLISLPVRVQGRPMPPVVVIDVRNDPACQKGFAIGRALRMAMLSALEARGQVILFLNLRGYSPVLWCAGCGATLKCAHCDVALAWHKERRVALCHSCGFSREQPRACPHCGQGTIRYLGTGTQRLEHEVRTRFGGYAAVRMDSDSMQARGSHDRALEAFRRGEARILLGTQMISKGLDFPNVTLVGVVDADTALHQPDPRSAERTFQLIAQVAGRTGRGPRGGRVLVQSRAPVEPAISFAARHDYEGFARHELAARMRLRYPPFEHLARVILRSTDEAAVKADAVRLAEHLVGSEAGQPGAPRIVGPAPAPVSRLRGNYRYHLLIASPDIGSIQALWRDRMKRFKASSGVELAIDVDPLNMK